MEFAPGREPVIRDGYQERFWALHAVYAEAMDVLRQAERMGRDVIGATATRDHALEQLEEFLHEHPDREFAAFRPELIDAAFMEGVPYLWPEEDVSAEGLPADK
jgi:hypothetical protein